MSKVRVEGRRDLQDALDRVVATVDDESTEAVIEASERLRAGIRGRIAYDTGALHDGVDITYASDGLSADVGVDDPDLYYVDFVEHGTSAQPAQPAFTPAAEDEKRELAPHVGARVGRRLSR